ncbi:MAG: hypothetical protein CMJ18_09365 [Phycisphaeraceae bacterium]|nr:hypothetical protein [Phycisphaeraceae bacterium]
MILDRKHRRWIIGTGLAAVSAIALYAWSGEGGSRGGSTIGGLILGSAALAMMIFLCGLGLKRRIPHWRLGRAQTWMRGHIWLGLLLVLIVALHGDLRLGGPLTTWLWLLLGAVTATGIFGLVLQQFIPPLLMHNIREETVAQQMRSQINALPELARAVVEQFDCAPLRQFFENHLERYLNGAFIMALANPQRSESTFRALRIMTSPDVHEGIDRLEHVCLRRRQLLRQRVWMRLLMGWLLIHVPLSWVLLLLSAVHAIGAMRWGTWS